MSPDRILVLVVILLCLHVFIVIVTWFEARIRPALVIVGLLDTEAEFLHKGPFMPSMECLTVN